ncbi:MAG TPA: amidase [Bryobacteraceae bacterium]|nr:amidase [Bryobacteraceae bacterium]
MTISQAAQSLRAHRLSAVELTASAIERIERLEPTLSAFITITAERALESARRADAELAAGRDRGPLHGIPIAVKDLFYTRGIATTAGSPLFEKFVPSFDATVVDRLEAAGAVMMGKLNLHELAYGITSANPHFGPVRNPWNPERSPGGSSGGSGAAVAAHMVYAAMGTDTGGSIRIPAAFCGTVGLKPTYGRVSRRGVLPLAFSLDHMGPLTRSVRDAAYVLNAIAGHDRSDDTSSRHPVVDFVPDDGCSISGLRVGFPENFYFEALDPDVESSVRGALARAESLGARITPVRVPDIAAHNAVGRIILLAEASALMEPHLHQRNHFGADVLALFDQGLLLPASDYINAQRVRRQMQREFRKIWSEVDCLITPTTPNTAPRVGDLTVSVGGRTEEVRMVTTRLVRAMNVLGLPALAMPCGLSAHGLPISLQIIGPAFEEATILRVGAALEDSGVSIPPCPIG